MARNPIRVLIVDDDSNLQELLQYALKSFGLGVAGIATNGVEAVEMFEKERPDAVVMDIMMPVMNGIEALRRIKAIDPSALVVMVTGSLEREFEAEARQIGVSGFLHKPFRVEELFKDIQENFRNLMLQKSAQVIPDDHYVKYVMGEKFRAAEEDRDLQAQIGKSADTSADSVPAAAAEEEAPYELEEWPEDGAFSNKDEKKTE